MDANLWFLLTRREECDIGVSDLHFGERWFLHLRSILPFGDDKNLMLESTRRWREKRGWKMDEAPNRYPRNMMRLMRMSIRNNVLTPMLRLKFLVKVTLRI